MFNDQIKDYCLSGTGIPTGDRQEIIFMFNDQIKEYFKNNRIIEQGTFLKYKGMYIGEANNPACKQNKNILVTMVPTDNFKDTITITTREQYKVNYRDHKKGDFKKRTILKKVPSKMTPNIKAAWMVAYDYPTVSYGLCNWRRDVLIIDSDAYYDSLESAKSTIDDFTKKAHLPNISYVLRNPSSGHIQAGWFLNEEFSKSEFGDYNAATKMLASMYQRITGNDGDICFNGPACKNPFYEGFESYVSSTDYANKEDILKYCKLFRSMSYIYDPLPLSSYNNKNLPNNLSEERTALSKAGKRRLTNHYFGSLETSRDAIECKLLREWVWKEMRNDHTPTYKEAREQMNSFALYASQVTHKPVHSSSELNSTTKCTLNWAVSKFVKKTTTTEYDEQALKFGRFIRRMQSFVLLGQILNEKMKNKNATVRMIAANVCCSIGQVSKLLNSNISDYLKDADAFISYMEDYPNYCEQYSDLMNHVKEAKNVCMSYIYDPLSLSSYNNKNETNDTEFTTKDDYDIRQHLIREERQFMTFKEFKLCNKYIAKLKRTPTYDDYVAYMGGLLVA